MPISPSVTRNPLTDLRNTIVLSPAAKKQNLRNDSFEKDGHPPSPPTQAVAAAAAASVSATAKTSAASDKSQQQSNFEEILIREWLKLPQSNFCIHYDLGETKTYRHPPAKNLLGFSMLQMAVNKCPFELKMQELKYILNEKFPDGAGLLYIREIFEPGDSEYNRLPEVIRVTSLQQHQVSRLRVMIVDQNLQDVMIPTLGFYERLPLGAICNVVDHFDHWKNVYGKLRDHKAKFNQLFSFTYALHKFDGWLYQMSRGLGRSKMVAGLATRWKNLFNSRTLEELNVDEEFSYPAIQALLQSFKKKVEAAPTFGDPRLFFSWESQSHPNGF